MRAKAGAKASRRPAIKSRCGVEATDGPALLGALFIAKPFISSILDTQRLKISSRKSNMVKVSRGLLEGVSRRGSHPQLRLGLLQLCPPPALHCRPISHLLRAPEPASSSSSSSPVWRREMSSSSSSSSSSSHSGVDTIQSTRSATAAASATTTRRPALLICAAALGVRVGT